MTLEVALGRTKLTEALFTGAVAAPDLALDLPVLPNITRAFAPMLREGRYPASEMAIASFLMAKAGGRPVVLLPVVLVQRFQEGAMFCRADRGITGPADLRGKRIGVRAFSQTTGMWLRGVLDEDFGLAPDAAHWVTFEDAHHAGYRDPPWVERAAPGSDMTAMLQRGDLDAAIFGTELPEDPMIRPVFPDLDAAAARFRTQHGCMPVNHLVVARQDVAESRTADLATLMRLLAQSGAEAPGAEALAPALHLASRWCAAQGLTPRVLSLEEIWAGTPAPLRQTLTG